MRRKSLQTMRSQLICDHGLTPLSLYTTNAGVKDVAYSYAHAYDLRRIYVGPKLSYPQYFCILGPSGLVVGGDIAEPRSALENTFDVCLCARQPRDPMQMWQSSRSGYSWGSVLHMLAVVPCCLGSFSL